MHPRIQHYINMINSGNTEEIYTIELNQQKLTEVDLQPLFVAIQNNPTMAAKIHFINLENNDCASLILPSVLTSLEELRVSYNYSLKLLSIPKQIPLSFLKTDHLQLSTVSNLMLSAFQHEHPDCIVSAIDALIPLSNEHIALHLNTALRCSFADLQSRPNESRKILLQKLEFIAAIRQKYHSEKGELPLELWYRVDDFANDPYAPLVDVAINPELELSAIREAYTFPQPDPEGAIFHNALQTLDAFMASIEGSELIARRQKEYNSLKEDVFNFNNAIRLVFDHFMHAPIVESSATQMSNTQKFYVDLQAVLRKYKLREDLLKPKKVLEIINPLLLLKIRKKKAPKP